MNERRATIRVKCRRDEVTGTHLVVDETGVGIRVDYLDPVYQQKKPGYEWVTFPWHMVIEVRRPWEDVSDNVTSE